jgi:hypothetical protein
MTPTLPMRLAAVLWIMLCFFFAGAAAVFVAMVPFVAVHALGMETPSWAYALAGWGALLSCLAGGLWAASKVHAWPGFAKVSPVLLIIGFLAGAVLGGWAEGLVLPGIKVALLDDPSSVAPANGDFAEGMLALGAGTLGIFAATFIHLPRRSHSAKGRAP